MNKYFAGTLLLALALLGSLNALAQTKPTNVSEKMAATVMTIWKDSLVMQPGKAVKWAYDEGVVLEGLTNIWKRTGDGRYFKFIQKSMDLFVKPDGSISRYKPDEYN